MLQVPHLARLTDFICTCMFRSCVKWGSTNTGWHINAHHVKNCTHMTCEVQHNGDMGMGHLCLIMGGHFMPYNGLGIYDLMGGAFMAYYGWGI